MKRTHLLMLAALGVAVWWFILRKRSSPGAGDRSHLGPVTGDTTPYWQYGNDGETVTGVGPLP